MSFWNRSQHPGSAGGQQYTNGSTMIPRWTSPPDRNTAEWIQAFSQNPRLAVVERIASDLSFAKGKLFQVDEKGDEHELTAHPFLDFWSTPNPLHEMSNAALWRLFEIYLKLKGEGYFIIERNAFGRPAELWPVPTHWVQMTPYAGHPFYTIRLTNGLLVEVSVDDIFLMKDLNPIDPFRRGLGQSETLADEIETDEYAAKFQKRFFYNDATPNLVISMPKSTDEQRKRFRAEWLERFRGTFKSHGVATVNGDAIINKLGDNMKDMDMVNGRTFLRNAVLEHFGVPREIMGITESSNRATSEAAQFIYAQNVLMPNLKRREEAINQQLLPYFGADLIWRFDDIVPRNQEFDKAKALEGWNAGLLTKDEARELLDIAPAKVGGDVYKTQFSDIYVRDDEDPAELSAAVANAQFIDGALPIESSGSKIEITDGSEPLRDNDEDTAIEIEGRQNQKAAQRKAVRLQVAQKAIEQAEREQSHRFEVVALRYFQEQNNRIIAALNGATKDDRSVWDILLDAVPTHKLEDGAFITLDAEERKQLVDQFVLGLLDWKGEEVILHNLFEPLWKETYSKGGEVASKVNGMNTIQRPELINTAKLCGGKKISGINKSTQQKISHIISSALEHGDGREAIAKQIQEELKASTSRARLIATQECNTSLNAGSFDMMKAAGAQWKTWHVTSFAAARDSHQVMDGQRRRIDEPFTTGKNTKLMLPCDPNCDDPSEVIQCHCFLTYDDY